MLWRETKAQTPRHDPESEPPPVWVDDRHSAHDTGADVTTQDGAVVQP
jgi:hypothetical protein